MNEVTAQDSTWKNMLVPRGKCHNKTETKTTVSLYLNKKLVEKARNRSLNLSRITEQALSSILDYLEAENIKQSSESLTQGSLPRETCGPVVQLGMNAAFAMRKSGVQIPTGPLNPSLPSRASPKRIPVLLFCVWRQLRIEQMAHSWTSEMSRL